MLPDSCYTLVDPIIVYPACIKAGLKQDCFNCAIGKAGKCLSSRSLCTREYKNHKHGCPNYGKRPDCPPDAPMFDEVFDIKQPIYAIFCTFDLEQHVKKMREKHPQWTEAQLSNVLYWQGTARKHLRDNINSFVANYREEGYYVTTSPEAMGVNVTETLKRAGITLEWPAKEVVYKVAMAGIPKSDKYLNILK